VCVCVFACVYLYRVCGCVRPRVTACVYVPICVEYVCTHMKQNLFIFGKTSSRVCDGVRQCISVRWYLRRVRVCVHQCVRACVCVCVRVYLRKVHVYICGTYV